MNQRHPDKKAHTYSELLDTKEQLQRLADQNETNVSHLIRQATTDYIKKNQHRIGAPPQPRSIADDLAAAEASGTPTIDLSRWVDGITRTKYAPVTYTEYRDKLVDLRALAEQELSDLSHVLKKATYLFLAKQEATTSTKPKPKPHDKTKRTTMAPSKTSRSSKSGGGKRKPARGKP
jgi:predicted transcriptional regulator